MRREVENSTTEDHDRATMQRVVAIVVVAIVVPVGVDVVSGGARVQSVGGRRVRLVANSRVTPSRRAIVDSVQLQANRVDRSSLLAPSRDFGMSL